MEEHVALSNLLNQLFDADELRRFAAHLPGVGDLASELPDSAAPPARVTFALVHALARRGLLDSEFFRRLLATRPRRSDEIAAVAARFGPRGPAARMVADPRFSLTALALLLATAVAVRQWEPPSAANLPRDPPGPATTVETPAIVPQPPTGPPPTTVKIASDNTIHASGAAVTVIGIQEGL